jgi:hypothetical protein
MEQLSEDEVLSLEPNLSPNVRPLCGLRLRVPGLGFRFWESVALSPNVRPLCGLRLRVPGLGFRFWESVAMSTNVGFLACRPSSNPKP